MARKRGSRDWKRWNHYQKYGTWPKNANASAAQAQATSAPQKPSKAPQTPVEPKKVQEPHPTLFDLPETPGPRYYGNLD
jgi:hypothetical protein